MFNNLASQSKQGWAEACRARFPEHCRAAVWHETTRFCYHHDTVDVNIEGEKIPDSTATTLAMSVC